MLSGPLGLRLHVKRFFCKTFSVRTFARPFLTLTEQATEFSLKDIGNRFKTDKVFLIESCKINETMNYDVM